MNGRWKNTYDAVASSAVPAAMIAGSPSSAQSTLPLNARAHLRTVVNVRASDTPGPDDGPDRGRRDADHSSNMPTAPSTTTRNMVEPDTDGSNGSQPSMRFSMSISRCMTPPPAAYSDSSVMPLRHTNVITPVIAATMNAHDTGDRSFSDRKNRLLPVRRITLARAGCALRPTNGRGGSGGFASGAAIAGA